MLKNKGFTLIELLVVIAIIAILTTFFVNTSAIYLKRSRDARRKSDLSSIQESLETYRADCSSYPASDAIVFGGSLAGTGANQNCPTTNSYIKAVPQDPQFTNSSGPQYLYWANSSQTDYEICAYLETGSGSVTCGLSSNCGSQTCNYKITSP